MHVPVPVDGSSLGLSLQWASLNAVVNIWHVLDVPANSPADLAGLLPYSDYILGSPEGTLHGESGLGEIVEDHIGRPLRLYVYNNEYDVTREITLQPSREWGGEGALGCVLGYGALHRLPAPLSEPVDAPGDTIFDGSFSEKTPLYGQAAPGGDAANFFTPAEAEQPPLAGGPPPAGGDFLVPAQMASAPPPAGNAPPRSQKKKAHRAPVGGMDDYFNEQEEKSRALDRPDSTRSKSPLGPPPKAGAGGPPKGGPPRAETPQAEAEAEESAAGA